MKKKVAFYIESLVVGGAEKVLIDFVNNLNAEKYEISVISLFKKSIYSNYTFQFEDTFKDHIHYKYLIDNSNMIKYRLFNYIYAHTNKSKLYQYLIKDKYDIEVAFYEGWPTEFVSFSSQNSYKIAWLHTNQVRLYEKLNISQFEDKKNVYQSFNQIVGVSEAVCQSYKEFFPNTKPICIYNPFQTQLIFKKSKVEEISKINTNVIQFITVGRLIEVKGHERLISALAQCKKEGYSFGLWMIGEGELKDVLKKMVKQYDLEQEIEFLGHKSNPYPYIKAADCTICSSYTEGLSTVVIESIILGKPVITTDCSGMKEILRNEECGFICENSEDGLRSAIKMILKNTNVLEKYGKQAAQRGAFFSIENRMNDLEAILDGAVIKI